MIWWCVDEKGFLFSICHVGHGLRERRVLCTIKICTSFEREFRFVDAEFTRYCTALCALNVTDFGHSLD